MMDNMTNVQTQELLTALRAEIERLVNDFETKTGGKVELVKPRQLSTDDMTVAAFFSASSKT